MRHSASSKLRPVLIAVGIIIVIAFVAIGLIIRQAQARYQSTIYTGNSSTKIDTTKPLSILLLGVDTGADGRIDKGNSDTIMVVTINPQTKKTLITSIPRDSLAEMVGDQDTNVQKLNALTILVAPRWPRLVLASYSTCLSITMQLSIWAVSNKSWMPLEV